jgi:heme a synthase
MVKSGLKEELMQAKSFHGVSQYWLAAHLGSAFVIYAALVLSGLEILSRTSKQMVQNASESMVLARGQPYFALFKRSSHITAFLIFMTAMSGIICPSSFHFMYSYRFLYPCMGHT